MMDEGVYLYTNGTFAEQKSYGLKMLVKLESVPKNQNLPMYEDFLGFRPKLNFFSGLVAFFGTFFLIIMEREKK